MPADDGFEPRAVAQLAFAARRSNQARSHLTSSSGYALDVDEKIISYLSFLKTQFADNLELKEIKMPILGRVFNLSKFNKHLYKQRMRI